MKKIISSIVALLLILSLAGCGVKEKLEEKAAEKAVEAFIEGVGGKEVDIDGDKVTIEGEDGEKVTIGGTEWPDSALAKVIPAFKKGTISGVMESADGIIVGIDAVEAADYKDYLEAVKKDFSTEAYEMSSEGYHSYGASNADGIAVFLQYGDGSLSITVTKPAN